MRPAALSRLCLSIFIGAALGIWAPARVIGQEALPPKQAFVRELQRALRSDDRAWIAEHMSYPVRYHGRTASVIRNRNDFVRNYSGLISDRLRGAILSLKPDEVFENWQGIMIGDGTHNMWARDTATGDAARYEIVTINDSN